MSRGGSCKQVMNEPSAAVTSIKASGDCFYECVDLAFSMGGIDVRACEGIHADDDGSLALRRTCAEAVDEGIFEQFAMFHQAGLPDYAFMNKVENAEGLKARMMVSGKQKGCGQCLWANEFEIGV